MAKLFTKTGNAVVETSNIAAVRNGRMKAQFPCVDTDTLENGMLVKVLEHEEVARKPINSAEACYLHASEERIYESHLGRTSWVLDCNKNFPRLFALAQGDTFETDAVDKGTFADIAAVKTALETTIVYGVPHTTGDIKLLSAVEAGNANVWEAYGTVLEVVKFVPLPNETEGIKFVVRRSGHGATFNTGRILSAFKFASLDNTPNLGADAVGVFSEDQQINVDVPFGTDVGALVATFTASTDATVTVGETEQVSGTTANDFTTPVVYTVTSESGVSNTYTVVVTIGEA